MALTFAEVIAKYNPHHDARGRFSTADGAASFSLGGTAAQRAKAIEREKERNPGWDKPEPKPRAKGGLEGAVAKYITDKTKDDPEAYEALGRKVDKEIQRRIQAEMEARGFPKGKEYMLGSKNDTIMLEVLESVRPFGIDEEGIRPSSTTVGSFDVSNASIEVRTATLWATRAFPADWHQAAKRQCVIEEGDETCARTLSNFMEQKRPLPSTERSTLTTRKPLM